MDDQINFIKRNQLLLIDAIKKTSSRLTCVKAKKIFISVSNQLGENRFELEKALVFAEQRLKGKKLYANQKKCKELINEYDKLKLYERQYKNAMKKNCYYNAYSSKNLWSALGTIILLILFSVIAVSTFFIPVVGPYLGVFSWIAVAAVASIWGTSRLYKKDINSRLKNMDDQLLFL